MLIGKEENTRYKNEAAKKKKRNRKSGVNQDGGVLSLSGQQ